MLKYEVVSTVAVEVVETAPDVVASVFGWVDVVVYSSVTLFREGIVETEFMVVVVVVVLIELGCILTILPGAVPP